MDDTTVYIVCLIQRIPFPFMSAILQGISKWWWLPPKSTFCSKIHFLGGTDFFPPYLLTFSENKFLCPSFQVTVPIVIRNQALKSGLRTWITYQWNTKVTCIVVLDNARYEYGFCLTTDKTMQILQVSVTRAS